MQEIQGPFHQYILTRTNKMIASHCKEKAIKGYIIDVQLSHVWIYTMKGESIHSASKVKVVFSVPHRLPIFPLSF